LRTASQGITTIDAAVSAPEAEQGDRAGGQAGADGDDAFGDVVGDGGLLEPDRAAGGGAGGVGQRGRLRHRFAAGVGVRRWGTGVGLEGGNKAGARARNDRSWTISSGS
jgi:hypothetical protein